MQEACGQGSWVLMPFTSLLSVAPRHGPPAPSPRALGEWERVSAWLRVLGMVNVALGITQLAGVVNGFSELILEVFGRECGVHSRSAVGMSELPFGVAVEIEAEVEIERPAPADAMARH
jgi:hypothetical protein